MSRGFSTRARQGPAGRSAWVFHAGALGDFVLIWPMLRALVNGGRDVTVVAPASKAALAAAELGVKQQHSEIPRFSRMWGGPAGVKPSEIEQGVSEVYSFVADAGAAPEADRPQQPDTPDRRWLAAAERMFPGARVVSVGPPGSASRAAAWRVAGAGGPGARVPLEHNPDGPLVLHVGAGSAAKRWPMDRWAALAQAAGGAGALVAPGEPPIERMTVLAGEVEEEQFTPGERRLFAALGGRFIDKLGVLVGEVRSARLFIGADSGPAHLAAQLGVRTLALFGPTDPVVWAPVGPAARVLAPESPQPMTWLPPAAVLDAARALVSVV